MLNIQLRYSTWTIHSHSRHEKLRYTYTLTHMNTLSINDYIVHNTALLTASASSIYSTASRIDALKCTQLLKNCTNVGLSFLHNCWSPVLKCTRLQSHSEICYRNIQRIFTQQHSNSSFESFLSSRSWQNKKLQKYAKTLKKSAKL